MINSVINHQIEPGSGDRAITNLNPSTGEAFPAWTAATADQVDRAVAAARAAFPAWSRTALSDRETLLRRYGAIVTEHKEELAEVICAEAGKPMWEARQEAGAVVGKIELSIKAYAQRCAEFGAAPSRTRFKPHGVLAVLGPFNFPAHLPNGHIVPALLAGNTVVFKPSERVPTAGQLMMSWWQEAGLPAGVLNLVQGDGETGAALTRHDDIDGVLFTGGSKIGEALRRDFAALPGKILALELGGNNPLVVWDQDNLPLTINLILQSAYVTSGQRCTCARRLIIPTDSRGDEILERLATAIDGLKTGPADSDPAVFMGPVINATSAERLVAKQTDLVSQGATVLRPLEHHRADTGLVSPGLLDASGIANLADEELFGPLLLVQRVESFEEAMQVANRTAYGLSAGLVSGNAELYQEFADTVRSGIMNWNTPLTGASGGAPFGGLGLSGNHRPSGFFAADYCSYAVASLEKEQLDPEAPVPPGLGSG